MTVLSFFPESLGESGLIAIPCIISHLTQIFADAFLAAKWALVTEQPKEDTATAAAEGVVLAAQPPAATEPPANGAAGDEEAPVSPTEADAKAGGGYQSADLS